MGIRNDFSYELYCRLQLFLISLLISVLFIPLAVICFVLGGNAARVNSRTSSKPNATGLDEEFDEFVPYQGDRFDIFDWNLSKVYKIIPNISLSS